MGRQRRQDPDGGWHHVMNRGAGRAAIFHTASEAHRFSALVGEGVELNHVEVHAYCWMTNHFHLLVRCPEGGLSAFMHRLGSMYTRYFNRRRGSDGPLFRSRFHSLLVDSPEYLVTVARYIHRNPLAIRPAVALDAYRWSSYATYAGRRPRQTWLTTADLLRMHGGTSEVRKFVEGSSPGPIPIEWLLDVSLATFLEEDRAIAANERRAVAVALLDVAPAALCADIERWLDFPSAGARRSALHRARQRVGGDLMLARSVDEALRLAA